MKTVYLGIAMLLVALLAMVGTGSATDGKDLAKIGIGGGWSVKISGYCPNAVATITAPNGVTKVQYGVRTVYGQTSTAPYKCICVKCNGQAYWLYF